MEIYVNVVLVWDISALPCVYIESQELGRVAARPPVHNRAGINEMR